VTREPSPLAKARAEEAIRAGIDAYRRELDDEGQHPDDALRIGMGVAVERALAPHREAVEALREARFYVDARATRSVKAAQLLDRIDAALSGATQLTVIEHGDDDRELTDAELEAMRGREDPEIAAVLPPPRPTYVELRQQLEGAVDAAVKLGQAMYNAGQQGVLRAYLREQGIDPDTYRWGQ
jgi:hypothetical protein